MKRQLLRVPVLAALPESSPLDCSRLFIFLVVLSLMFSGAKATAQSQARAAAETLTRTLMDLQHQYQTASAPGQPPLALQMRPVAAQRQHVFSSLIQTNPGQVLQFAIPAEVSAHMPASVQTLVEQHVQIQGELQVVFEDRTNTAVLHHFLKTAAGKVELKFAEHAPTNLLTGSTVKVEGVQVGNTVALACCTSSSTPTSSLQTLSPALPNTFGAQATLVMLVNFQDNTSQPYTVNDVSNVMYGASSSVTGFYLENSLQQTWFSGDVVGWYTLPIPSTTCDNNAIATYANQAATAAGVNLGNYSHYVYAFPSLNCFGWWGLSTIGGTPSQSWINGSFQLKVAAHELGHSLGLYHSHAWYCSGGTTLCSNGTLVEYGDAIDMMGNPTSSHFNAFQKERLGWLNYGTSPPINQVQADGSYTIGPYENQDNTTKALKILQSTDPTTGVNTWYYVEYRQASGYDQPLYNDSELLTGVLIHSAKDADPNSDDLLNMAPSLNNFSESALDVGQTFIDPSAGLTLTTVSTNSTGATVNVTFGTPGCTHYNPAISLSPSQSQNVPAGSAVTYGISLKNNDNAGCNSTTFNLTSSVPAGWNGTLANSSLTVPYGGTGTTSIQVTSPSNGTTGQYSFTVTGTDAAATNYTGSASGVYNLNTTPCSPANPTVTLSPGQSPSEQPGATYTYTLRVLNNDNASCNTSNFVLSDAVPQGWTASLGISSVTVAPGASAGTYLYVTSPSNASGGSYAVTGSANNTSSGYSGTASASYIVAGGNSCTRANPTVSMSPSQSQSSAAGTAIAFQINVTDNDSLACPTTNFNMGSSLPSGWSGVWSSATLALSPGTGNSTTLTVTSPSTASGGTYTVTTTATNGSATSYFGSASANYVVSSMSGTSISVATNSSSYLPGQTVGITVTVTSGGTPLSGASVSVSVINPNGSSSSLSGTTGSNGVASMSYTLKKQAQAGTYQAQAGLSSGGGGPKPHGASTATVSTSFVVQ